MLEIFKTFEPSQQVTKIEKIQKGSWINIVDPTRDEIEYIQESLDIFPNFLRDPLDEEEKPRIDVEDNQTLIIVDTPYVYEEDKALRFETRPMGIIITNDYILTINLRANPVIDSFKEKKIKGFYTFKKTRFTLQILFMIAKDFLKYLRHIDKKTDDVEKSLHRSMRNKELFKLLELEKSLVFFTTSLKSNEMAMEKLLRGRYLKMYDEDQDLLEDVIVENKQAIEMANIYSSILSGMMGTFASVISNNLNMVMKFLTSVTIVMAIPTMIYSFYGMNVINLPFDHHPNGYAIIFFFSMVVSLIVIFFLSRRQMF